MEIIVILIITELLLLISFFGTFETINDKNSTMRFIFISLNVLVSVILMTTLRIKEKPKAIDVYRGNTTLKITYKDGVPIDSTVVWKNK